MIRVRTRWTRIRHWMSSLLHWVTMFTSTILITLWGADVQTVGSLTNWNNVTNKYRFMTWTWKKTLNWTEHESTSPVNSSSWFPFMETIYRQEKRGIYKCMINVGVWCTFITPHYAWTDSQLQLEKQNKLPAAAIRRARQHQIWCFILSSEASAWSSPLSQRTKGSNWSLFQQSSPHTYQTPPRASGMMGDGSTTTTTTTGQLVAQP